MPGSTVRIGDNGEILLKRCALTFDGYLNKPDETRAAFTDDGEWLRTGDLGHLDEAGLLHVTGREKELIALSGGKKVAPAPIERRLMDSDWISQAVLFGENRKFVCALLVLRQAPVEQWARARGFAEPYEQLLSHPAVHENVQRIIDHVNGQLSRPEQIKRFAVLPAELSAERDELTPTLKIRRAFVEQKYQAQLAALYT
jgi:long-chain acyl-CoA synthetase